MSTQHSIHSYRSGSISLLAIFFLLFVPYFASGDTAPFSFVAIGDSGCGCSAQQKVAQRMLDWFQQKPFHTVVMLGDNIYGGGDKSIFVDRFDKYYNPLVSRGVKFYATLGNHDVEVKGREKDEILDKNRFHILGEQGYYSFSPADEVNGRPLITFFVLNSERLLKLNADPAQIAWLSKELTDSKAIWKVVYFHEPIYAPGGGHEPEGQLKEGIEKILIASGVQMVLAGHSHFYARLKPQGGITHIITGGAGRPLKTPRESPITASIAKEYHFVYFEVFQNQLTFKAIPVSGSPLDEGMILQEPANQVSSK